jgi:maltose-binding protein MalE
MRAIFNNTPQPPANLAVVASLTDPYLAAFAVAGKDALPLPSIPEMGAVWEGWTNALTLVSQQRDDPVHAFTTAAEQIRKKIAETTK